jgi:TPR repeat protein
MRIRAGIAARTSISHTGAQFRCATLFICLSAVACAPVPTQQEIASATEGRQDAADLYVVDCLLPGQVRRLGNMTYLTPRRPTRTTAVDCRTRGGEYVAYDRADLNSALRVWMAAAEEGDPEAQNTVGEIFERGLGGEPNYEAAVIWYTKAAEQGHSAAQLNLGTLYERGLGVPQDKLMALNLYRQSWGLAEDDVIYRSAANREIEAIRAELEKQITEQQRQIELLERQIDSVQSHGTMSNEAEQELEDLRAWVARLRTEQSANVQELSRTREPSPSAVPDEYFVDAGTVSFGPNDFGRYYALIIGNQDYQQMEDLASPASDSQKIAALLQEKYGFTVQLLQNANDVTVLQALNNLSGVIKERDNLLIYYAGHGSRRKAGNYEAGYWLPVNANRPPDDTFWVPTSQVTDHIAMIKAQRILVIADSCYAGLLENEPGTSMMGGDAAALKSLPFIERRMPRRSRLLVSSGGDRPVLDTSGTGNSVFANAFLKALQNNDSVLTTPALFIDIREDVQRAAGEQDFDQLPEYKIIKRAGHEVGDFFFVPKTG